MAAPVKKERILATQVRELSLNLINRYLTDESPENEKFRKDLILKLSTNILPRVNQLEGPDGGAINIKLVTYGDNNPSQIQSETIPAETT